MKNFICPKCGKILFKYEEENAEIQCNRCKQISKFKIAKEARKNN